MIKLIIFDYDGVLADCKDLHYESLNLALSQIGSQYIISRDEHISRYDGLSTERKLHMLTEQKGLPVDYHKRVWQLKQEKTKNIIRTMEHDLGMISVLRKLKDDGYKIAVASNSIRETLKLMLFKRGLLEYIDYYMSNEDVTHPKPATEIYLKCMIISEVSPKETLIIEDSKHGRKAALNSGAYLLGVNNTRDVTYDNIINMINNIMQSKSKSVHKWQDKKMKVVIPMAGRGSRFEKAGYTFPKPLIDVNGKPMIQVVVENLNIDAEFIYVVQQEHYDKYNLKTLLNLITPGCKIVITNGITEGAACTILLAKDYINNNDPLLLANSDQYLEWDSFDFMYSMIGDNIDAGIVTFKSTHPKWSFVRLNDNGYVTEVQEKNPISDIATAGIYYWKRGSDFVKYAEQMIEQDIRVNGEYYTCPVFNRGIADGLHIKIHPIDKMWGIGVPEDLNYFLQHH